MWASVFDEHRRYLSDQRRLDAFAAAFSEAVRPGSVVVDLGAGTGVLGMLAVRAGAARVYAIEGSDFAPVTRELLAANGMRERVVCVRGQSSEVELPEPADLVVGDQLDGFIIDAGLIESFADAAHRFLRPGGVLIPSELTWHVAPVTSAELADHLAFWRTENGVADLGVVAALASNVRRHEFIETNQVLAPTVGSEPMPLGTIPDQVTVRATTTVESAGMVDALAGWFRARVSSGSWVTNDPTDSSRLHRPVVLLPLIEPIAVVAGDRLRVDVMARPAKGAISWRAGVDQDGPRQHTFLGEPFGREELRKADPGYRPTLTNAGKLRRRIYDLCDGERSRAQIEETIRSEFADHAPPSTALASVINSVLLAHTAPPDRPGS